MFFRFWLPIQSTYHIPEAYRQSLSAFEATKPSEKMLIKYLKKIGRFLREFIYYDDALPLLMKAGELAQRIYGEEHLQTAKIYYLMAELNWNQGKWDLAEPLCRKALQIREKLLGDSHPDVAMALVGLGEMELRKESHRSAQALIERALRIRIKNFGKVA